MRRGDDPDVTDMRSRMVVDFDMKIVTQVVMVKRLRASWSDAKRQCIVKEYRAWLRMFGIFLADHNVAVTLQ